METKSNRFFNHFIVILGLTPFFYWITTRINQDSWWDELISLKDFSLVDFGTTISIYPDPNNHIFF